MFLLFKLILFIYNYIFRSLMYDVRFIVMCVRAYERAGPGDMALYKCL